MKDDSRYYEAFEELIKNRGYRGVHYSEYTALQITNGCNRMECGETCGGPYSVCPDWTGNPSVYLILKGKSYMIKSGNDSEWKRAEEILSRNGFEKTDFDLGELHKECLVKIKSMESDLSRFKDFEDFIN
jgi:hypothetical protein